ncbi:unnamed protein product [Orchesella dallaii]|uniref:Uncharacterized protein n=1 Tax=Orchesella dallaii TaxID=48710 RepID=A0ABP1RJR9_9HEXA
MVRRSRSNFMGFEVGPGGEFRGSTLASVSDNSASRKAWPQACIHDGSMSHYMCDVLDYDSRISHLLHLLRRVRQRRPGFSCCKEILEALQNPEYHCKIVWRNDWSCDGNLFCNDDIHAFCLSILLGSTERHNVWVPCGGHDCHGLYGSHGYSVGYQVVRYEQQVDKEMEDGECSGYTEGDEEEEFGDAAECY